MIVFVGVNKNKIFMIIIIFILVFENVTFICLRKYNSQILYEIKENRVISKKEKIKENKVWKLEIPKINLVANIEDGTSEEILNKFIGHFEMTGYITGNIALAAHNRGYPVNYFENIKYLKIDDEVIYYYKEIKQIYKVSEVKIIKDTQVEVLKNTNENIITLITCVENRPEYRRCIVAKKL